MTKLSRVLFPVIILIIPTIIILHSCTNENNLPGDECNIVIEDNLLGKLKSDVSNAVLKPDSTLWTWGINYTGQFGNGTTESSDIPLKVPLIEKIIDFDMWEGMAIAADCTGNIWFWGKYMASSLYWPEILSPVNCSFLSGIKAIGIVGPTVHMLRNDGTVWSIRIGPDVETSFYEPEINPDLEQIVSISQSIALSNDCILYDLAGGLFHVSDVVAVQKVLNRRIFILKKDGTVWAWGKNSFGALGNGSFEYSASPVKVKNLDNIIQISANYDFNLALKEDGTVWFWGFTLEWDEDHVPIGISIPEKISNLDNVALIYAGITCLVMKNDGSYWHFNSKDRIPQLIPFE